MIRLLTVFLLTFSTLAICHKWSGPQVVGSLDSTIINESSGIAISKLYPNRLYNINDSGSGPFIYSTTIEGRLTKKYKINDYRPYDMEDLAVGTCGKDSCVYIADIGDNKRKRDYLSIVVLKESDIAEDNNGIDPIANIRVNYPSEKFNAESLVVHPNGDIYILTKVVDDENRRALPAKLFKVSKDDVSLAVKNKKGSVILKEMATVDLPYQLYNYNLWGRIAVGMDISEDGKTLLILTYSAVFEFKVNFDSLDKLDSRKLDKKDFNIIKTKDLFQQEAIAYNSKDKEFIYTTEVESRGDLSEIVRHTCLEP